ncbi:MAG: N-carbamoylputrescine amidase [Ruminococcus sp.]|nr:N-carbamoylputrescine amidase [Ruminococcus sp.]
MRKVTVAATQMKSRGFDREANIQAAEALIREAAGKGANIILIQELFQTDYFCQKMIDQNMKLALPLEEDPAVKRFSELAKELDVVLPVSFFEKDNQAHFNSLAIIDADGTILGTYRKSHIPDGAGYSEKFYFNIGDTGFKVWKTKYATIGCAICWDQWYPEAARAMALMGAELLFYPTAIGSEPDEDESTFDSMPHWRTVMQGHAGANLMPVIASNRIGTEYCEDYHITFYGSSFIADEHGQLAATMDRETEGVITATFDLDELALTRRAWGVFRDRRPELYTPLLTQNGKDPFLK